MTETDGHARQLEDVLAKHSELLAAFESMKQTYEDSFESLKEKYDRLLFEHEKLRRRLLGPSRERVPPNESQLELPEVFAVLDALGVLPNANEGQPVADASALAAAKQAARDADKKKKPKQKARRRDLSELDLPIERIVLEPPERDGPGGDDLVKIGEEVSEHVERRAETLVRVQVVRPKYRRPEATVVNGLQSDEPSVRPPEAAIVDGAQGKPSVLGAPLAAAKPPEKRPEEPTILIAPLPARPIEGGLAGPGLLAYTLVSKYCDHLPWHRLSSILAREGFPVARSTLSDWVKGSVALLFHITRAMWEDAKANASYLIVDATGVLVQAKEKCQRRSFYVAVVPGEHVLYRYLKKNDGASVAALFEGFSGYIHADAASVYHELYDKQPGLTEVACWAHTRRYFFEAYSRDPERALTGIGYIGQLYEAHRASLDDDGNVDADKRRRLSRPVLAKLFRWVRREQRLVKPGTPIAAALGYLRRQRRPLLRFLEDGRLRLDTNLAEGALRRQAKGRDNWLFCATDEGAQWNTVVVSLVASCQMHGVEPWAYLRDVLTLLPVWDQTRALELAPKHWAATLERPDTQALLDAQRLYGRQDG